MNLLLSLVNKYLKLIFLIFFNYYSFNNIYNTVKNS